MKLAGALIGIEALTLMIHHQFKVIIAGFVVRRRMVPGLLRLGCRGLKVGRECLVM